MKGYGQQMSGGYSISVEDGVHHRQYFARQG